MSQEVLVARLTIWNGTFTTDFRGTKEDLVRSPAFMVAGKIEAFVEHNLDALLDAGPES